MEDFSNISVLIADDSRYFRALLRAMLHGFGLRNVYQAENGAHCLELIEAERPDLLFLDWEMPVLDGPEVMRHLRIPDSLDAFLPVIMVTAHTERHRVARAQQLGVNEVLSKPTSPKVVHERLSSVVMNPRPFIRNKDYFGPEPRTTGGIVSNKPVTQNKEFVSINA